MKEPPELKLLCDLISIAAAGAKGKTTQIAVGQWSEILSLSLEHNVISLLACTLLHANEEECPDHIRGGTLAMLRGRSSENAIRQQRIMALLNELNNAGVSVKLLKGHSLARYYAYPESRDAVDTDIWIGAADEQKVYDLLEKRGFQIVERSLTSHHGICQHRKYGKIEVHVRLYDEIVETVWFSGSEERFVKDRCEIVKTPDGQYCTLGPTDQLVFLTLHMVKHFIDGGLSIRMMLDLALHCEHNKRQLDYQRYWRILSQLHYADFVNAVLWILIIHGKFSEDIFEGIGIYNDRQVKLVLRDLATGGYMGKNEAELRYESAMEYNRQRLISDKTGLYYVAYMLAWKIRSGYKLMFSSPRRLLSKYSFLQKLPFLFPVIWLYQFISFPVCKIRNGVLKRDIRNQAAVQNDGVEQRVEMFKQLEML